jgi:DNA-3-methyladenine glycosylase II
MRLTHAFSFTIHPIPPYSFELSVHKPGGWPLFSRDEDWADNTIWTALHIGDTLVGVKLYSTGTVIKPEIQAQVFLAKAPTKAEKEHIESVLIAKLGADTDLKEFYALAAKDPILRDVVKDLYGLHNTGFSTVFGAATLAITLQMAPIARSNQMQECLVQKFGELAEFDGHKVRVWPKPHAIARAAVEVLFKDCKLGYRAKFLIKTAQVIEKCFPTLEELQQMTAEDAKKKIMELPGIGDYSSDIVSPHGGFSIDVWSADIFGKLFFGTKAEVGRKAIDRIKAEGLRRWGKWARTAFVYVVHDIPRISKRVGMPLREH